MGDMAWAIYHVGNGGYFMREKACQMVCQIWHGIEGHDTYGLTWETLHGLYSMLLMMEMT
jgi:hypothetical protein